MALSPIAQRVGAAKARGERYLAPPRSETGLYASEDGRRGCVDHTPIPHSDTWRSERWSPVGWDEYFAAFRVYPDLAARLMACETCGYTPRVAS